MTLEQLVTGSIAGAICKEFSVSWPSQSDNLAPDEMPLFDAMKEMIPDWGSEQKQIMGSLLMLLLSCAEDDQLNMNKVAEIASHLEVGLDFNSGQ